MLKYILMIFLWTLIGLGCGDSGDDNANLASEIIDPASGDPAMGQALFLAPSNNCFFCHGNAADGVGGSQNVNITNADAVSIQAAVRTGPGVMEAFSQSQISTEDLNDIIAWLLTL